jgi:uncharacterized protein YjbI with pentapeptide repeats
MPFVYGETVGTEHKEGIMKRTGAILKGTIFILSIAIVAVAIGARSLPAFTETDVEKVKTTGCCEGCNLSDANLGGEDLANASLSGADLGGANLRGANLSGADLTGARLVDAFLNNARLVGANLTDSTLSGACMDDANFSQAVWTDGKACGAGSRGRCAR